MASFEDQPKRRGPRIARPPPISDKLKELQDEIAVCKSRRDACRDQARRLRDASSGLNEELKTVRNQFQALRTEFSNLKAEREAMEKRREALEKKRSSAASAPKQDRPRFRNVAEIDERIATLEYKQGTESMDLRTERNLLKEIKELRDMKDSIAKAAAAREGAAASREAIKLQLDQVYTSLKAKRTEIDAKRKEMDMQYEILKKMGERRDNSAMKKLFEESDEWHKKIQPLFEKIQELRDEDKRRWDNFKKRMEEARKAEAEAEKAEAVARKAAAAKARRAQRVANMTRHPWEEEIAAAEQVATMLRGMLPAAATEAVAAPAAADTIEGDDGKVLRAVRKGDDEEEDFLGGAVRKGKKGKKGKKGGKGKKKQDVLRYDLASLAAFQQLGVAAPKTVDQVADVLKAVEDKIEFYNTNPNPARPERKGANYKPTAEELGEDEDAEAEAEVEEAAATAAVDKEEVKEAEEAAAAAAAADESTTKDKAEAEAADAASADAAAPAEASTADAAAAEEKAN